MLRIQLTRRSAPRLLAYSQFRINGSLCILGQKGGGDGDDEADIAKDRLRQEADRRLSDAVDAAEHEIGHMPSDAKKQEDNARQAFADLNAASQSGGLSA